MSSNNSENRNTIAGALTYPSRSEENTQPVPIQPREPWNMQGLLRFAMEATKAEDAPGNSELGPMDEERRRFLEEALKSLTVDVAEVMQQAIKVLTNTERMQSIKHREPLPADVQASFSNLLEFVDDIDVANVFYKMGGFAIFPICYGSDNDEVRALASTVLAELCQNNRYCQSRALECGLLHVLLRLLFTERLDALDKCIYAVSCVTREYEPACRELLARGGCGTLAQQLHATKSLSARAKAAFLIKYLCNNYSEAREQSVKNFIIITIAEQIKSGRDESTEHLLSILLTIIKDLDPAIIAKCRDPNIDLKNALEGHLKCLELENERFIEEKEYCQEILKILETCPHVEVLSEEEDDT